MRVQRYDGEYRLPLRVQVAVFVVAFVVAVGCVVAGVGVFDQAPATEIQTTISEGQL